MGVLHQHHLVCFTLLVLPKLLPCTDSKAYFYLKRAVLHYQKGMMLTTTQEMFAANFKTSQCHITTSLHLWYFYCRVFSPCFSTSRK